MPKPTPLCIPVHLKVHVDVEQPTPGDAQVAAEAIRRALDELGVPGDATPSPIVAAVQWLRTALTHLEHPTP